VRGTSLLKGPRHTGRTHQIRVHMAAVHHPCCGDPLYGCDPVLAAELGLQRQWLHAAELSFTHPGSGQWATFTSPLPEDLDHALAVVRAGNEFIAHP
ncbi:MAG: RNA pseudouridine synthase, partial [Acidipropionibacterium jensenii]|nr:RNA pseudouridine synthase [Acidipropionibacterium jensenii]